MLVIFCRSGSGLLILNVAKVFTKRDPSRGI